MSVPTKDGAWVSATMVARFYCTHCGYFLTKAANEREIDDVIRRHIRDHHNKAS